MKKKKQPTKKQPSRQVIMIRRQQIFDLMNRIHQENAEIMEKQTYVQLLLKHVAKAEIDYLK